MLYFTPAVGYLPPIINTMAARFGTSPPKPADDLFIGNDSQGQNMYVNRDEASSRTCHITVIPTRHRDIRYRSIEVRGHNIWLMGSRITMLIILFLGKLAQSGRALINADYDGQSRGDDAWMPLDELSIDKHFMMMRCISIILPAKCACCAQSRHYVPLQCYRRYILIIYTPQSRL